jgi:hypothetical protein
MTCIFPPQVVLSGLMSMRNKMLDMRPQGLTTFITRFKTLKKDRQPRRRRAKPPLRATPLRYYEGPIPGDSPARLAAGAVPHPEAQPVPVAALGPRQPEPAAGPDPPQGRKQALPAAARNREPVAAGHPPAAAAGGRHSADPAGPGRQPAVPGGLGGPRPGQAAAPPEL